jgi:ribose transport system substrate-binding protein
MHRRTIVTAAALLAGALGLGLTACSGPSQPTRSRQVALVVANINLNFSQELAAGFRTGVAKVDSTTPVIAGPPIVDGEKELAMFHQIAKAQPGGISVFTLDPQLFTVPLATLGSTGMPLIGVDNPPLPGSGVKLFIGNDNFKLGQMLADQVIARLPADAVGDIVLGNNSPGAPVLDRRAAGMLAEFTRKLPSARVLGPFDTKQEVASNLASWRLLVKANPTAIAFVGTGDADGWNLAAIRQQAQASWIAAAFDLDPRSLDAVRAGALLLVSPEHFTAGQVAGQLQAEQASSDTKLPEGWIEIPGLAVNAANVDAVIKRQSTLADRQAWFAPVAANVLKNLDQELRPLSQIG